jgi:predicted DNA-binding WGR domain protein
MPKKSKTSRKPMSIQAYLDYKDAKSSKFWEIETNKNTVSRRYGKIGAKGTTLETSLKSSAEAVDAALEMIREKARKGYQVVRGSRALRELSLAVPVDRDWKLPKFDTDIFKFLKRKPIQDLLAGVEPPERVQRLIDGMNHLSKQDGILWIEEPIDRATGLVLLAHPKARYLKEVRRKDWAERDLESIRKEHASNFATFRALFGLDVPDLILELKHYQDCMKSLVTSKNWFTDEGEFTSSKAGIFKHVFSDQSPEERDALVMRYTCDPVNYFPMYTYRSTAGVNRGLAWDYENDCFCPFFAWNDTGVEVFFDKSMGQILLGLFEPSMDYLEEEADWDKILSKETTSWQELGDWINSDLAEVCVRDWFFLLATVGYLNAHRVPDLDWNPAVKPDWITEVEVSQRILERSDYANSSPRLAREYSDRFHPSLSPEFVEALLRSTENTGYRHDLHAFPDELEVVGMEKKLLGRKRQGSVRGMEQQFSLAVANFCRSEIDRGRPWLALLAAECLWQRCEKRDGSTELAAELFQDVPDELCHPLIKLVARLHSETRFDKERHL